MPDPETAIRVLNGLRAHLPLLQGLGGQLAVLVRARTPAWRARASRSCAPTRAAACRARFATGTSTRARWRRPSARRATSSDYTFVWWDVRAHPRLGTVEVREMDAQAVARRRRRAGGARAGAGRARRRAPAGRASSPAEAIAESSFRASRDGIEATILHDGGLRAAPRGRARDASSRSRGHARELGVGRRARGHRAHRCARAAAPRASARRCERGGIEALLDRAGARDRRGRRCPS